MPTVSRVYDTLEDEWYASVYGLLRAVSLPWGGISQKGLRSTLCLSEMPKTRENKALNTEVSCLSKYGRAGSKLDTWYVVCVRSLHTYIVQH